MKKLIAVDGVELELNLSVNYFYKFFYEITGRDLLLNSSLEDAVGVKSFDYAAAFIAAGHMAHAKISGSQPLLTKDEIEFKINSLPLDEAALIVMNMVGMINEGAGPNAPKVSRKGKKAGLPGNC